MTGISVILCAVKLWLCGEISVIWSLVLMLTVFASMFSSIISSNSQLSQIKARLNIDSVKFYAAPEEKEKTCDVRTLHYYLNSNFVKLFLENLTLNQKILFFVVQRHLGLDLNFVILIVVNGIDFSKSICQNI